MCYGEEKVFFCAFQQNSAGLPVRSGILRLHSVLNGDDSWPSPAGRQTATRSFRSLTWGDRAATPNDGIMLVESLNGATTTPGTLALAGGSVSASAYEYLLFRGSSDDAQRWDSLAYLDAMIVHIWLNSPMSSGRGVAASLSREIELYSAVSHTSDDDSEHRQDLSGNVGVKIIW